MKRYVVIFCTVLLAGIFGVASARYMANISLRGNIRSRFSTGTEWDLEDGTIGIKITAVGDCTLGTDINAIGNESFEAELAAQSYNYSYFLKNVVPFFENDDLTIVNFEGTLSSGGLRRDKEYAFRGLPEYAKILTTSSVEAANLANNHSRDYGDVSAKDTKAILSENNILWFEGKNYAVTEIKGIKVGLIGTYSLQREQFIENMEELKALNPQLIIASFHWGDELSHTPNENQKILAHTAIDNGADLVIGHHPHVLQGIEKYKSKYILYSLGNFCFGGNKNPTDKDTMIFQQVFRFKDNALLMDSGALVIPCSISSVSSRNNYQPSPLRGRKFRNVKNKIINRSSSFKGIEDIVFIEG